jgi:hypothetical protein
LDLCLSRPRLLFLVIALPLFLRQRVSLLRPDAVVVLLLQLVREVQG